ncbi:MAG: hypothetical protein KGJ62_12890 [Armatimonadetes bacterium]|nr:hypothetical protein [Armatimonadota bacterium]MDE2206338.1 hypothetical protein [Armatimonadota bacterium]
MTPIRAEDKPKLYAILGALGIVVLYLAVFQLPKVMGHSKPSAAVSTSAPVQTASASAPAGAAGVSSTDMLNPIPALPADPFKPPVPGASLHSAAMQIKPVVPSPMVASGLGGGHIPPPAVQLVPVSVQLQGVITGSPAVAVFQVGAAVEPRTSGQQVVPTVTLHRISDGGVYLTCSGQDTFVPVGHDAVFSIPGTLAPGVQPPVVHVAPQAPGVPVGALQPAAVTLPGMAPAGGVAPHTVTSAMDASPPDTSRYVARWRQYYMMAQTEQCGTAAP